MVRISLYKYVITHDVASEVDGENTLHLAFVRRWEASDNDGYIWVTSSSRHFNGMMIEFHVTDVYPTYAQARYVMDRRCGEYRYKKRVCRLKVMIYNNILPILVCILLTN